MAMIVGIPHRSSTRSGWVVARPLAYLVQAALLSSTVLLPAAKAAVTNEGTLKVDVQSPFFGDVLYRINQQQYFSALTAVMVSQERNRLTPNDADAELLRGGMLLNNGLHREAGQVFERLTERGVDAVTRRRAWLLLAKARYQRGLPQEAAQALSHVDGALSPEQEDERVLLLAQINLSTGQFQAAAETLKQLAAREQGSKVDDLGDSETQRNSRYARFNLGVAQVRGNDVAGGMQTLDALGQASANNEEMRALRDQANVALGFSALQANQPENAKHFLERVRLKSVLANKALLGFGWADLELKNPTAALVPWEELVSRDPGDAAVLEGRLAYPYALAQAGQTQNALTQYEEALRQFDAEALRLEESIKVLRSSTWLEQALALQPGEEMGWNIRIPKIPAIPHAAHLNTVFAQDAFQQAFRDQRDLQFLYNNLSAWQAKLDAQLEATRYRTQVVEPRIARLRAEAERTRQPEAIQRANRLLAVNQSEQTRATADEQRLQQALERVQRSLTEVAAMRDARLRALQDLAVDALVKQQQRLASYTTQARFGLAQMYDRALKDTSNQGGPRATSR